MQKGNTTLSGHQRLLETVAFPIISN